MAIKRDYLIEKSNFLNEMRFCEMSLQEVRFLGIYMSKINARNLETRVVKFSLDDFRKIMELGRLNIDNIKINTKNLLQKVVTLDNSITGGYTQFQLFKECRVDKDENNEWYIEIDAHDKALPYFFEFKKNNPYFAYKLENTLRLNSTNQIRMYELLKQHQKQGQFKYNLSDLRDHLYISKTQYPRFGDFRIKVLEATKKELSLHTDICFEYKLIKKGAKVTDILFIISKNDNFVSQLTLSEFIDLQKDFKDIGFITPADETLEEEPQVLDFSFFSDIFNNEFTIDQVQELYQMSVNIVDRQRHKVSFQTSMYDYLLLKFRQLNAQKNVKYRYPYLKKLIKIDADSL